MTDGVVALTDDGQWLVFACGHCNTTIRMGSGEPIEFVAYVRAHVLPMHDIGTPDIRYLGDDVQEAMVCIFDGQPDWLHEFDTTERNY